MTDYTEQQLFGGGITSLLPADSIDASDLRQVPDHQEVFVRPDTLTSTIFEINEYQTPQDISEPTEDTNTAAAEHHLRDVVDEDDRLGSISTHAVKLSKESMAKFPAFMSLATIISSEIDRSAASTSPLPVSWQQTPVMKDEQSRVLQLLIRMEEFETDLCVRINVPLREFTREEADKEVAAAHEAMERIVESLDLKDTGLFG